MKKLLFSAAAVAAAITSSQAGAQPVPPAVVAVVDGDQVRTTCNACKTAIASLQSQAAAQADRMKALSAPLETEQKSIQTAIDALNGKEPDAALQTRAKNFQAKLQQAQAEAERGRQQLQANQAYVIKQIEDKLNPVYSQVMQKRGANILLEAGSTLAASRTVDITADVLAALNAALPAISTTAPAQAKPQGR